MCSALIKGDLDTEMLSDHGRRSQPSVRRWRRSRRVSLRPMDPIHSRPDQNVLPPRAPSGPPAAGEPRPGSPSGLKRGTAWPLLGD